MQVNFNPSVNQVRPNFKASFSEDFDTRLVLDNFNNSRYEQINLLATHYALQDMTSNDKISLVENYSDNTIYAKNLANGKEIQINGYHAYYGNDVTARLREAIENGKLIDEKPKFDIETYTKKAAAFLGTTSVKENKVANHLKQQIKKLEDELKIFQDRLWTVNHNEDLKRAKAVKKEIFLLAKKVK